MRRLALSLALAVSLPLALASDRVLHHTPLSQMQVDAPLLATQIDGWLVIDGEGRVSSYEPTTAIKGPLRERLLGIVKGFEFEPVHVDGKRVIARTKMRLSLSAQEQADKSLKVAIDNVTFPTDPDTPAVMIDGAEELHDVTLKVVDRATFRYPDEALGLNARVLVAVRFNADGTVQEAAIRQSALVNARGAVDLARKKLLAFETETLRRAVRMKVQVGNPTGRVLDADDLSGLLVVNYVMDGGEKVKAGVWQWEMRSAFRESPWSKREEANLAVGIGDVRDGDALARLDSPFKLRTDLKSVSL